MDTAAAAAPSTVADDIHPPNVVTLSPVPDDNPDAIHPDSPLSTPPDSPRSMTTEEDDIDDALQAHVRQMDLPLRRRSAELLLERKTSLELPIMPSHRKEGRKTPVELTRDFVEQQQPPPPTSVPSSETAALTSARAIVEKRRLKKAAEAPHDDDAPDDEKKVDDFPLKRLASPRGGGAAMWMEEPDDEQDDNAQNDIVNEPMVTSTSSNRERSTNDHVVEMRHCESFPTTTTGSPTKVARNLSASLKTSSFHTAHTFDELMSAEVEPPSLHLSELPRLSVKTPPSNKATSSTPEEDGELPRLTSPPPPSPPMNLDLASPDSTVDGTASEDPGKLPAWDVSLEQPEDDGQLPRLSSSPVPPSPPMNLDLASPDTTMDVSSEYADANNDHEEPPSLSQTDTAPSAEAVAADAHWQSRLSIRISQLSRSYSSGPDEDEESSAASAINEPPSLSPYHHENAKPRSIGQRSKTMGDIPSWKRSNSLDEGEFQDQSSENLRSTTADPSLLATSAPSQPASFLLSRQRPHRVARGRSYTSFGSSGNNSSKFVSVDRDQHLRFAALKRDILSRQQFLSKTRKDTGNVQSHSEGDNKPSVGVASSWEETIGSNPQVSVETHSSIDEGTASSPDRDIDALELSVMVSPDGEIDYSRTILNVLAPEDRKRGIIDFEKNGVVISTKETEDSAVLNETRSNDTGASFEAKQTIHQSSSSGSDKHNAIRSVKSDGGSSVASKTSSYTPPNQAWSDYLTFRGVAVESPSKTSTYDISDIGKAWVSGRELSSSKYMSKGREASTEEKEGKYPSRTTNMSPKATYKAAFREMTPNKDLQGSDKSSGWLEEELKRRAFVKREINNAIEERGKVMKVIESEDISDKEIRERSNSVSDMDDEVAAITGEGEKVELLHSLVQSPSDGRIPGNGSTEEAPSRQLFGAQNNTDEGVVEDFHPFGTSMDSEEGNRSPIDYEDMQVEMRKFASDTRAALRDQSFTEQALAAADTTKFMPVTSLSPIPYDKATSNYNPNDKTSSQVPRSAEFSEAHSAPSQCQPNRSSSGSKSMYSVGTEFADLHGNEAPVLIRSMDCFDGIAKGDITLSLLSENTGSGETSVGATWANRVKGAIWRSRRMRSSYENHDDMVGSRFPGSPARDVGTLKTVASTQDAAISHLKHDEIDEAIELFEEIIFAYYSYFEKSLNERAKNPGMEKGSQSVDFQLYIGVALHNLGVLNLLKGGYVEALSFFTRAAENRMSHMGEGHPDHISSLVKVAVCRYALNEFAEAHARLEEALVYARRSCITIDDRMMVAEILNNLGCLAYMCGQPVAANSFYRDSMDVQFGVLSDSLYAGNAIWGRSISLNISITRANIGFVKLVTKELQVAITALENALMEQQILLKGAHETIIATMDHVAVANILFNDQEKAAMMFRRILELQRNEYGPNDRRCFVTIDKIKMVQSKGAPYEEAVDALHRTFTMPAAAEPRNEPADDVSKASSKRGRGTKPRPVPDPLLHRKQKGKGVMKVLNSIRKKKP